MTRNWTRREWPLTREEIQHTVAALDAEYVYANGGKVKPAGKSPAQEFDESHAKWKESRDS